MDTTMNKRYQIFVSSTYADLAEERQKVFQALLELDCIPSAMELFPATDEEQWAFIKKIIEDCDYYILIIGWRYGSITAEGISYTEQEFDFAVEKGLKVIAFLHSDPIAIPRGKTDNDTNLYNKLIGFRRKVETGRLVKYWKAAGELPGLVALSLPKTMKAYPAEGWIRARHAVRPESELTNALQGEIDSLKKLNASLLIERETLRIGVELLQQDKLTTAEVNFLHLISQLMSHEAKPEEESVKWQIIETGIKIACADNDFRKDEQQVIRDIATLQYGLHKEEVEKRIQKAILDKKNLSKKDVATSSVKRRRSGQ